MKWKYIVEISWKNLMNRKTRSILTISGVIIGIAAITFLISIGYGFEKMTTERIASKESLKVFDVNLDDSDLASIDEKNIADISNNEKVDSVEPALTYGGSLVRDNIKTDIVLDGYTNKFLELSDNKLLRGNFYKDDSKNEIVVSTKVLNSFELDLNNFNRDSFVIEVICLNSLSPSLAEGAVVSIPDVKIVGVIDDDESSIVIAPTALVKETTKSEKYNLVKVKVKDKTMVSDVKSQAQNQGFGVNYIGDTIEQINSFFTVFRYIVGAFGFVSMLVAILGMFNTLTVSLLERTREIGVLKSNGALKRDIWRIFLSEAIIISLVGGIFGLISGVMVGTAVNSIFNIIAERNGSDAVDFFYTPLYFVAATLFFISLVGFLTGYYPARRATKISALDALKYE